MVRIFSHCLKTLQQKQQVNKPRVKAPIDDYINERKEHPKYNMIDDIDDILNIDIQSFPFIVLGFCFWQSMRRKHTGKR